MFQTVVAASLERLIWTPNTRREHGRNHPRFLQQAARVRVDGAAGPVTLAAVRQAEARGLIAEYCARRSVHYSSLAIVARFGLGWFRQLFDAQAGALRVL